MRVQLIGECDTVNGLRGMLVEAGFQLVNIFPSYTIEISEAEIPLPVEGKSPVVPEVVIDSVLGDFEQLAIGYITELNTRGRVLLKRQDGNQDDKKLVISVAKDEDEIYAVQLGVTRALLQLSRSKKKLWLSLR